jgi:hypothetical protein
MVALGELRFIPILAVAALVEPVLLLKGNFSVTDFASVVLAIQTIVAALVLALGLHTKRRSLTLSL